MTTTQRVAQIFGWAFILTGLVGFFYTGTSMEADLEQAPRLFGIFPVNVLHNLVHLGLGVWGVMAARSWSAAKGYCVGAGAIYLVLAVLGFVVPTMFGLVPIGGNDIWLHIVLALPLLYFGLTAREHSAGAARART